MMYLVMRKKWGGYDTTQAMVVRANSEEQARKVAVDSLTDEAPDFNNPDKVTVERIAPRGKTAVILTDFHAG